MRPKAKWDTGELKVGIFPYYVIRRGVTILLFGSLIKKETLHRIQYTFIMSDKNGYNNGMFVVAMTRHGIASRASKRGCQLIQAPSGVIKTSLPSDTGPPGDDKHVIQEISALGL